MMPFPTRGSLILSTEKKSNYAAKFYRLDRSPTWSGSGLQGWGIYRVDLRSRVNGSGDPQLHLWIVTGVSDDVMDLVVRLTHKRPAVPV